MAASDTCTPVHSDCPVCLDPIRAGYARITWCAYHPICRECAESMNSIGYNSCPVCRRAWSHISSTSVYVAENDTRCLHNVAGVCDMCMFGVAEWESELEASTAPTDWSPYTPCLHGRYDCTTCLTGETALDDMLWSPEGDQHEGEEGEVPLYVLTLDVSF